MLAGVKDGFKLETWQRVLLLQGPVGPVFRRLRKTLNETGFVCFQVLFNAGDRLFAGFFGEALIYKGEAARLEDWLREQAVTKKITHMVLFGSERPVHIVARRVADRLGIIVISLEEGYIRPGAITLEFGANNALSPIAGQLPPRNFKTDTQDEFIAQRGGFLAMCVYGALYYGTAALFADRGQRHLLHRRIDICDEMACWTRNLCHRIFGQSRNSAIVERLLEHHVGQYFVVPLQVSQDTQMGAAARGWNNARLIGETLVTFAQSAPAHMRLVFKIHPLERGRNEDRGLIDRLASELGIDHRVDIVDVGSIGHLTRHSAGIVTINSTSGFSAIHHGVPLLVIGDAIYANAALATCAFGNPDFAAFWQGGHVAPVRLRKRYIAWIRKKCLHQGDFFTARGMEAVCNGVIEAIRASAMRNHDVKEAA